MREKKQKTILIILIISLIFFSFISAIQITTFSDGSSSGNITFSGNENHTMNITIPRNANVTSAYMNLSGFSIINSSICYQESADVSDQSGTDGDCNLDYTGTYGGGLASTSADDGNWGTGSGGTGKELFINYTKPINSVGAIWTYSINDPPVNIIIPQSCWDYSPTTLSLKIGISVFSYSQYCYDGSFNLIDTEGANTVNEEAITWNISSVYYPTNTSLEINNTNIWNYSEEFNSTFSPNKTNDFSSTLNTALNDGLCDCDGCTLDGNNCSIPFTFHSDTAGKLGYSDIQIDYDNYPFVNLISPENNTQSPADKTLNCSATDEIQLSNVTFYIWNSTNDLINQTTNDLTGTSNSSTLDVIFDKTETVTWNCLSYNNNSRSYWADSNFTLLVDIDNPVITINYPENNSYEKGTPIFFNYTPEHSSQTIETCELWGNFTGSFKLNQSDSTITEDIVNSFNLTLDDSIYFYGISCNTSETGANTWTNNYTLTVDNTFPTIFINDITTTAGSQTFNFNVTSYDLNADSCKYSILNSSGGIDGISQNISFSCNTQTSATTTDYGTYDLMTYIVDLAGNEQNSSLEFTTSTLTGGTVGGGGGGGTLINVLALIKSEDSTGTYSDLQRAIVYSRINDICEESSSTRCSLFESQKNELVDIFNGLSILIDFDEVSLWATQYRNNEIENVKVSIQNSDKYDLDAVSVVITESEFIVSPKNLDTFYLIFTKNPKPFEYIVKSSKKLDSGKMVIAEEGMELILLSDTTAKIVYTPSENGFFAKSVFGTVNYVATDGKSAFQEIQIRVFNLRNPYFIAFTIVLLILISLYYRYRKILNKRFKQIFKIIKMRLK